MVKPKLPEPELVAPDDAIVQIGASGICGSDLHIYHGRVPVERGFTIGHEFVGTVLAAGPDVERLISDWLVEEAPERAPDRILGAAILGVAGPLRSPSRISSRPW